MEHISNNNFINYKKSKIIFTNASNIFDYYIKYINNIQQSNLHKYCMNKHNIIVLDIETNGKNLIIQILAD